MNQNVAELFIFLVFVRENFIAAILLNTKQAVIMKMAAFWAAAPCRLV
jgi:hypothetical protein